MKLLILSTLCVLATIDAQIPFFGKCQDVKVKQSFSPTLYSGVWYENRKFFFTFELGGKCITAEYTSNPDGTVKVVNNQTDTITNKNKTITGSAKLVNPPSGEARLIVTFPGTPARKTNDSNYQVLDTDYTSFASVFSCTNYGLFNKQSAWLLTRARYPSQSTIDAGLQAFRNNGVNVDKLKITKQTNC